MLPYGGVAVRDSTIVKVVAIISLTVICSLAIVHGIDSALIGTVSAIIGGIAGYELRKNGERIKEAFRRRGS
jgi:hypothetical protein